MAIYECKCGRLFNDCDGKAEIESSCPVCGTGRECFRQQKKEETEQPPEKGGVMTPAEEHDFG